MADNPTPVPKLPTAAELLQSQGQGSVASNVTRLLTQSPVGSIETAIGDTFYGINHRQTPNALQINKDFYGITFFTRPEMNMTKENLRSVRLMNQLLNTDPNSIQRIIRNTLDPKLSKQANLTCPFIDEQQAFIPILTNTLLSISGWPDVVAPVHTSPSGMYQESFSFVDGITSIYSTYDVTANFRNIPGDPITLLFLIWTTYESMVYEGTMVPRPEKIVQNEIDYNTRIYRLVLDYSKTRVQKIACTGASFPTNTPLGSAFNYESSKPIDSTNDQISINFRCTGACYQDPIIIYEFNKTVELFNPSMADGRRERSHVRVPIDALEIFNHRGYARINPETYVLEWWIDVNTYNQRLPQFRVFSENDNIERNKIRNNAINERAQQ